MYEGLTTWDLSSADKASVVIPGLATEWAVSPGDKTKWIFKLRPGVKFHDGSDFDADAVVWNVEKVLKQDARAFRRQPGRRHRLAHAEAAQRPRDRQDDGRAHHRRARRLLPINLTNLYMASPAHWKKLYDAVPASVSDPKERNKQAWDAFARTPRAPGRGRWTGSCRASGSSWSRTTTTGT